MVRHVAAGPDPAPAACHRKGLGQSFMTSQQFVAWRQALGMSKRAAADALGLSVPSIYNYEQGFRREDGRPVRIPRAIALACAALAHGLAPWDMP